MNIPVNLFMWLLAFLPIAALLLLMIGFQWGATKAAPVGLVITILTGMGFYRADIGLIACESAKGIWNAMVILIIVWTAILMYQAGEEARAFLVIRNGMRRLLPNELLLVIAMGWIFESFLQGITGFGVPVAVGAPLLIGIGVHPLWAVIIPLFGQAWGNTFGTLAAAWEALAMSAGLEAGTSLYLDTALWTAAFLFLWNAVTGVAICWFYGGRKALRKGFAAISVMSLIQGGGELLLSRVNTTLCCFIPSVISLVVLIVIGRLRIYRDPWSIQDSPIMDRSIVTGTGTENDKSAGNEQIPDMTLVQAFVPYILLSVLTLVVLLAEPVNRVLGSISFGFSFPETSTGYGVVNEASTSFSPISPFTHASMFLLLSALIGMWYYRKNGWIGKGGIGRVFARSFSMTAPSGIAVIGLVIMSRIMSGTGQTIVLANGIADVLGRGYAVLAPFVGLLGTFMTGSNMSSNILFGDFQMRTAELLNISVPAVLGAQSAGGAVGSAISPSKIILGSTTANILGQEGLVMKKIIAVTVPVTILIGLILFALVVL